MSSSGARMAAISLEQYASCLGSVLGLGAGLVARRCRGRRSALGERGRRRSRRFRSCWARLRARRRWLRLVAEGPLATALIALAPSERQPHAESLVLRVVRELTGGEAVVAAGRR